MQKRQELQENGEADIYGLKAAILWDQHWSHRIKQLKPFISELNLDFYEIPAKATDHFSILDVAVNKPFKDQLKSKFTVWCTEKILEDLNAGIQPNNVKLDVATSIIKPKIGEWIIEAWQYIKSNCLQYHQEGWRKINETIEHSLMNPGGNEVVIEAVN
ncbi:hypothetical protein P9112_002636 [Eukaryota sp. TZLM1-RC]